MSLGQKSICKGITLKGKQCNRLISKTKVYCFQHINQLIKHGVPVIQPIDIDFIRETIENNSELLSHCTKRNKYGEYICKEKCVSVYIKRCDKHSLEFLKFHDDLKKIQKSSKLNVTYFHVSYDRKFKLYNHLVNYLKKHREHLFYTGDKLVTNFISSLKGSLECLSISLYESNYFTVPFKLRKQNKSYEYYKSKFELHISELEKLIPSVQIRKNIDIFISNSIKIQKISECYVKFGNSYFPVICKGINEKILSFII